MTYIQQLTNKTNAGKIFFAIFAVVLLIGTFVALSSFLGQNSFNRIEKIHLKQYQSAGTLRQKTLEIIGIYYLLASDQDLDILMEQLQRYDGLSENFQTHLTEIRTMVEKEPSSLKKVRALGLADEIDKQFAKMNGNARAMTFSIMEGNKETSKVAFGELNKDLSSFERLVAKYESIVVDDLKLESTSAQNLLNKTMWAGIVIILLGLFAIIVVRRNFHRRPSQT